MPGTWERVKRALGAPVWGSREVKASPDSLLPAPRQQSGLNSVTGYGSGRMNAIVIGLLPGTGVDYAREAGDLSLNSAVAICNAFYCRNWPQARVRIARKTADGTEEMVDDHPAIALLNDPMPGTGIPASLFWEWIITDYHYQGNGYLRKRRSMGGFGPPVGFQFLPSDMVAPEGDGLDPLTHYTYRSDGRVYPIGLGDIVHFRQGRNPIDMRLGWARINSVLREIVADNKGSTLAVALAENNGMATTIISPKDSGPGGTVEALTADDARTQKRQLKEQMTGDNFGGILVLSGEFQAEKLSFSPQEMALDEMRCKPEERIAGVFGIPPIVVQFGAGLKHGTLNNYEQARQQAWEDGIIPLMAYVGDVLTAVLLPDFPGVTKPGDRIVFDASAVRALTTDENDKAKRAGDLFQRGVVDRAQAIRISGGIPNKDKSDEGVYYINRTARITIDEQGNEQIAEEVGDSSPTSGAAKKPVKPPALPPETLKALTDQIVADLKKK